MYGDDVDTLSVYLRPYRDTVSGDLTLWQWSGNEGNYWKRQAVSIPLTSTYQVKEPLHIRSSVMKSNESLMNIYCNVDLVIRM